MHDLHEATGKTMLMCTSLKQHPLSYILMEAIQHHACHRSGSSACFLSNSNCQTKGVIHINGMVICELKRSIWDQLNMIVAYYSNYYTVGLHIHFAIISAGCSPLKLWLAKVFCGVLLSKCTLLVDFH